jgi:spore coat protein A
MTVWMAPTRPAEAKESAGLREKPAVVTSHRQAVSAFPHGRRRARHLPDQRIDREVRMLTRRRFVGLGAMAGAGAMISWPRILRANGSLLDPLRQPKFVNPLPNPLDPAFVYQPVVPGGAYYEIGMRQFQQSLGLVDPDTGTPLMTTVWGYGTATQAPTYPGRTIVARKDLPVLVRWSNELIDGSGTPLPHLLPIDTSVHWAMPAGYPSSGVPVVTHLHGGHNRSSSDGLPDAWFTPYLSQVGRLFNPVYEYLNDQEAATLWYHDHALGITRLNVYAGLAGFYILRDDNEDALAAVGHLPQWPYEVPIVIQDRMFTESGQLFYPSESEEHGAPSPSVLPEFFGDVILVNGQAWPVLEVEPRPYRLRLLNGSDSRFYNLFLSHALPIHQIGSDTGLLNAPVAMSQLLLGPGERADVVIDFSDAAGQFVIVQNNAREPFPKGKPPDRRTVGRILAFNVNRPLDSTRPVTTLPSDLRPVHGAIAPLVQTGPTRHLLLFEGLDAYGRLQPLLGTVAAGALGWMDPMTELVQQNDVEVWEVYNTTEDAHPIHLHEVSFQVLGRQRFTAHQDEASGRLSDVRLIGQPHPPEPNETGWKDTVLMYPREVTRIIAKFDLAGEYVWHCHILSHEDHEMMRPYIIS